MSPAAENKKTLIASLAAMKTDQIMKVDLTEVVKMSNNGDDTEKSVLANQSNNKDEDSRLTVVKILEVEPTELVVFNRINE